MIERVILILKTQDMTSSQFADEIGVQRSSISHILSGRNNASLEFVTKILKRFPDLNSDWLIFGKGAMYRDSNIAPDDKSYGINSSNEPDLFSMTVEKDLSKEKEVIIEEVPVEAPVENTLISPKIELKTIQIEKEIIYDTPEKEKEVVFERKVVEPQIETEVKKSTQKTIEKIVILYTDKTFKEYFPE